MQNFNQLKGLLSKNTISKMHFTACARVLLVLLSAAIFAQTPAPSPFMPRLPQPSGS